MENNKENIKHIPLRMCIACRSMKPKSELLRFVKGEDKQILIDTSGKIQSRGIYLCKCTECVKLAKKKRGFERFLKSAVDERVYDFVMQQIEDK